MSHEVLDCWDTDGYLFHCNGTYAVQTRGRSTVIVHSIHDTQADPLALQLDGQKPVTALHVSTAAIGTSDPTSNRLVPTTYVFVAHDVNLLAWPLELSYAAACSGGAPHSPSHLLTLEQTISNLCVCPRGAFLAMCSGKDAHILELRSNTVAFRLEGHAGDVADAEFCPHASHILVTISEDRTFKLWDLHDGVLLHQSFILGAQPLTALSVDMHYPRMAVGSSDGVIRMFDLSSLPECRCSKTFDAGKALAAAARTVHSADSGSAYKGPRVITSKPSRARYLPEETYQVMDDTPSTPSSAILSLAFFKPKQIAASGEDDHGEFLLHDSSQLLIGTPSSLAILDTNCYQLSGICWFSGDMLSSLHRGTYTDSTGCLHIRGPQEAIMGRYCFSPVEAASSIVALASPAFGRELHVLAMGKVASAEMPPPSAESEAEAEDVFQEGTAAASWPELSVFQTQPLPDNSPLRAACSTPSPSTGHLSTSSSARMRTPSKTSNQPVTFHRKVKSSGYGFVQQAVKLGRSPAPRIPVKQMGVRSASARHLLSDKTYPVSCGLLTQLQKQHALPGNQAMHHGPIFDMTFSPDAARLLTASSDKTARSVKLPLSRHQGDGTSFMGHNAAVNSVCCSHDCSLTLTGASDRSAHLYSAGHAQPLLKFSTLTRSPQASDEAIRAGTAQDNGGSFKHEIRRASFMYLDQIIVLACGNKLHLYKYKLKECKHDDIERLRNNNTYRLLDSYSTTGHVITHFSCINSCLSPLILTAASNRAIEILDASTMQQAACFPDAHARPVHTIRQACMSLFTSPPREAHELFATCAADSTAKLWDVRSGRCVRSFQQHSNRQVSVGLDFSPCLRYLGVGSEDKTAVLYDLRMGSLVCKIRGVHGDTVSAVAFNPLHPQLATGCLDGKVHFYTGEGMG